MENVAAGAVQTQLQRRVQLCALRAVLSIVFGSLLTLLAPLILGSIFWWVSGSLFHAWYPWSWFFLATGLITVPLLFQLEERSAGRYLSNALEDSNPVVPAGAAALFACHGLPGQLTSLAMVGASNPRAVPAGFVELFLFGPRLVLNGIRHRRQARLLADTDVRRAAEVVAGLLASERGLHPERLQEAGEDMKNLVRTLVWLVFYGWVGVSDKMDRVYLYTESREALGRP